MERSAPPRSDDGSASDAFRPRHGRRGALRSVSDRQSCSPATRQRRRSYGEAARHRRVTRRSKRRPQAGITAAARLANDEHATSTIVTAPSSQTARPDRHDRLPITCLTRSKAPSRNSCTNSHSKMPHVAHSESPARTTRARSIRTAVSNDVPEPVNRRAEASRQELPKRPRRTPQTCPFRYAAE